EVVALELRVLHLAVAAEVDAVEAVAESLDVTFRERRRELREHRALQLEALVREVAAMMVVVDHHQRPRAGDEVAAGERGQAPRFDRFERLGRGIDAAEPRVRAWLAATLFPGRHGAKGHQVVPRPYEPGMWIALIKPFSLLCGFFPGPGRVDLLIQYNV